MSTSQSEGTTGEMVAEQRPIMAADIYNAAIQGDTDFFVQRFGLSDEERRPLQEKIEGRDSATQKVQVGYTNVRAELQSATHSGDTILHLLVTKAHNNDIAQKIFRKELLLLKASNSKLETPLHVAAKAGNYEVINNLIQIDPEVAKDAIGIKDNNGNTALHMAAKYGHGFVSRELMNLDPQVAYQFNKDGLSPLQIAIVEGYNDMVKIMLEVDFNLVGNPFSDEMFPVHAAARMGNTDLVNHFFKNYPHYVELQDQNGRNLFHIAAAHNKSGIFTAIFNITDNVKASLQDLTDPQVVVVGNDIYNTCNCESGWRSNERLVRMINAKDYQGNTPLHIAAINGAKETLKTIWERLLPDEYAKTNNRGLTPFESSMIQVKNKNKDIEAKMKEYVAYNDHKFTRAWFSYIMEPSSLKTMEKLQIIGLGSVLITTVAFAAAFTFPGGYNPDEGTPLFGRRYMFKAFILANTLAFIQSFASIFSLAVNTLNDKANAYLGYAEVLFLLSASCMVVAFGSGSYVMLVPINKSLAIIILVLALLFGPLPFIFVIDIALVRLFKWLDYTAYKRPNLANFVLLLVHTGPFLFIFCLAFLK